MYAALEGCLGIGKTTVAQQLRSAIKDSCMILEDFKIHPFLRDFYKDPKYTFETELTFLLIHYHQLLLYENNNNLLIGDYYLGHDNLYAELNLDDFDELRIFKDLYGYLSQKVIKPDLIICLSASTDLVFNRIRNRDRELEDGISFEYIDKINKGYNSFFADLKQSFVTIDIDMNTWDFAKDPTLKYELIDIIKSIGFSI